MAYQDQNLPPEPQGIVDRVVPSGRSAPRVLLVDDEFAACKLLSIILAAPEYHCALASNGEEALIVLERERFDAVISDLQMPGLSGMQLLAIVRRRETECTGSTGQ